MRKLFDTPCGIPLSFIGLTAFTGCADGGAPENYTPNVLIILADQHHKGVMGFEGHPDVITPNLDRLAGDALIFERAYCNAGICAPSRTALMTGLYPRTLGLLSNREKTSVMEEAVSLATIFRYNNYATYAWGKRHTSLAVDKGWDEHRSHLCNETPGNNYVTWVEAHGLGDELTHDWAAEFGRGPRCLEGNYSQYPVADLATRVSKLPEDMTMEAFTARHTIETIRKHAGSGIPFFCWATFYRPHQPYTPQQRYLDMYDISAWGEGTRYNDRIRRPESLYEPKENLPPMMQSIREGANRVWNVDKAFEDEQLWRNYIGSYYALVTEIDHYVGEIIDALEEEGILDRTIIIYLSDHGDFVGNHGMVEKCAAGQNVYEDILNIPLIIRYPGREKQGVRVDDLVSLIDIFPTLVDLLSLHMPDMKHPLQGNSFAGLVREGTPTGNKYVVSESWSQATVITREYKLGMMIDPGEARRNFDFRDFGDMFFVRSADPMETQNQINNPVYKTVIDSLRGIYEEFKEQVPDTGKQESISSL